MIANLFYSLLEKTLFKIFGLKTVLHSKSPYNIPHFRALGKKIIIHEYSFPSINYRYNKFFPVFKYYITVKKWKNKLTNNFQKGIFSWEIAKKLLYLSKTFLYFFKNFTSFGLQVVVESNHEKNNWFFQVRFCRKFDAVIFPQLLWSFSYFWKLL